MAQEKQIFPGGKTAAMRKQEQEEKAAVAKRAKERAAAERAAKDVAKSAAKEEHREFLKNIGPATRLLIVRRGLRDFLVVTLMSVCVVCGFWSGRNLKMPPEKRVSYIQAFKHAYDVRNLIYANPPYGMDTVFTVLLLIVAAGAGIWRMNNDKKKAKEYVKDILHEAELKHNSNHLMTSVYLEDNPYVAYHQCYDTIKNNRLWKLHPVCKSIVKNIASTHPDLFERLLSDKTGNASRDYAIAVIRGYLKTHPDEFQRVLDVYDVETLPKSLVRKYAKQSKQR